MLLSTTPPTAVRRRTLPPLLCALVALLAAAPSASAAVRQVAVSGSDSGNCLAAPCHSLGYAYGQAAAGDVVAVGPGSYPGQVVSGGSKAVVFKGTGLPRLRSLDNGASNVVFDGLEVDGAFTKQLAFHNDGDNSTFRNGRIGNVTDEKGALVSAANFTFDNVVFHDVRVTDPQVHNECVYAIGVPGMTVRNSHFYACATMDLFFTWGTWWVPAPPGYGNVTLENNVFEHSTMEGAGSWHYYSLYVGYVGPGGGSLSGWTVRNNTFEIDANLDPAVGSGNRWVGNLGGWSCKAGITYRHNVGDTCGGSGKSISPSGSSAALTAPLGWLNPRTHDFRLGPGRRPSTPPTPTTTPPRTATGSCATPVPTQERTSSARAPRAAAPA